MVWIANSNSSDDWNFDCDQGSGKKGNQRGNLYRLSTFRSTCGNSFCKTLLRCFLLGLLQLQPRPNTEYQRWRAGNPRSCNRWSPGCNYLHQDKKAEILDPGGCCGPKSNTGPSHWEMG